MESTLEDMSLNVLGFEIVGIGTLSFVAEKGAEGIDDVWSLVVSRVISADDFVSPATPGNSGTLLSVAVFCCSFNLC